MDGDWCLVDLSEPIMEEATKYAHALGMNFYQFVCTVLEEKLAQTRGGESPKEIQWEPLLK